MAPTNQNACPVVQRTVVRSPSPADHACVCTLSCLLARSCRSRFVVSRTFASSIHSRPFSLVTNERRKRINNPRQTDRVSPTRKVIYTSPFLSTRNHPVEESPIMAPRQRIMTSTRNSASTTTRTEEDSAALAANSTPLIKGIKENIPKRQPVATQTEADNARDRHDYFNLIALVCTMEILGAVHGPL